MRQSKVPTFVVAILVVATATTRAAAPLGSIEMTRSTGPAFHSESDGVRLRGRWFEEPSAGRPGAARRLAAILCGRPRDFHDPAGRDLRHASPSWSTRRRTRGWSSSTTDRTTPRADGLGSTPSPPGSRVVRTCPTLGASSPRAGGRAVVIHEVLHTSASGVPAAAHRRRATPFRSSARGAAPSLAPDGPRASRAAERRGARAGDVSEHG